MVRSDGGSDGGGDDDDALIVQSGSLGVCVQ
jgi:hypothetical protein